MNYVLKRFFLVFQGDLRVCVYCCKIVLSYLRSSDANSDLTDDLKTVQEDLQNRLGGSSTPDLTNFNSGQFSNSISDHAGIYRSLPRRKASVGYQEERFVASKERTLDNFSNMDDKPKIVWDWVSLKAMWEEMLNPVTGIDWATHRHNMMKYCHSCVVGSELVDWLLAQRKITWRGQGVQIGQLLIDANLLECVSQAEQVFLDAYALYKPVQVPLSIVQESAETSSTRSSADFGDGRDWGQDPLWVTQIKNPNKIDEESEASETEKSVENHRILTQPEVNSDDLLTQHRLPSSASLYSLDLNLSESTVTLSKPKDSLSVKDPYVSGSSRGSSPTHFKTTPKHHRKHLNSSTTTETMTDEFLQKTLLSHKEQGTVMVAPTGWHSPHQLTSDSEVRAFQQLCNSYVTHENNLLGQLLENLNLSTSWADVILPIVHKVTEIVRPDVRHADDEMDIRQYIRFKKLPGGTKENCRIVNGVVCTKNVAHRHMRNRLKDPKILLISSSIDYQRFENRFLSLEPLVMQEHDYLKNTVARIASMKPDLVIVEKTVSRLAQEFMLDHGITLVINVKPSIMERVGRLTQGIIWESADTQLGRPQLGLCHNFYLETFQLPGNLTKTLMFFDGCAMHLGVSTSLNSQLFCLFIKNAKALDFYAFKRYFFSALFFFVVDLLLSSLK
jgi:1-phosphatidylinositol-3-phosphate 5-kinase